MSRTPLLPSAFLISTIFFSIVSATPIPIIHEVIRVLARQGSMGEFEPVPSSAATPTPTPTSTPTPSSSSSSITTPLDLRRLYSRRYSRSLPHQTISPPHSRREVVHRMLCPKPLLAYTQRDDEHLG
jgi:hypothetical protein